LKSHERGGGGESACTGFKSNAKARAKKSKNAGRGETTKRRVKR